MNNIFFCSDLHFGHNKFFLYEPRGFSSIEEHDEGIIDNWNHIISSNDTIYLLGDIMLSDNDHGLECLSRLQGKIYYIRGNHCTDTRCELYKNTQMIPMCSDFSASWAATIIINKYHFYLSHYPTVTSTPEANKPLRHSLINLHGHTHSKEKFNQINPYMYNVCLDAHNNTPVAFDTIIEDYKSIV